MSKNFNDEISGYQTSLWYLSGSGDDQNLKAVKLLKFFNISLDFSKDYYIKKINIDLNNNSSLKSKPALKLHPLDCNSNQAYNVEFNITTLPQLSQYLEVFSKYQGSKTPEILNISYYTDDFCANQIVNELTQIAANLFLAAKEKTLKSSQSPNFIGKTVEGFYYLPKKIDQLLPFGGAANTTLKAVSSPLSLVSMSLGLVAGICLDLKQFSSSSFNACKQLSTNELHQYGLQQIELNGISSIIFLNNYLDENNSGQNNKADKELIQNDKQEGKVYNCPDLVNLIMSFVVNDPIVTRINQNKKLQNLNNK